MKTHDYHSWFDEWMGAAHPRLLRLFQEGVALVSLYEKQTGLRKRQRRPVDHTHHRTAIEVTVANLAHTVLHPGTGRRALLTGNGTRGFTRYDNPAFGRPFRVLLDTLSDIGWLDRKSGFRDQTGAVASSIAPTAAFADKVHQAGISLSDFGRVQGEELILSTRKVVSEQGELIDKEMVAYSETPATTTLRNTMRELNGFLTKADIDFVDDGLEPVDIHRRVQRRHFLCDLDNQPSFSLGGRLYGGDWQNLRRSRRRHIRIEGEPVALLDYASMAPRLAYASVGAPPPPGDIYDLPGLEGGQFRSAVKKAFNTLLCDTFERRRGWPTPKHGDPSLPTSWGVPRFKQALLSRHPVLLPCLGTGMAPQLQNTESTILIKVLEEMKARAIPVLSLHDGLICASPRAAEVMTVMKEAASDLTSAVIPVGVQHLPADL